MATYVEINGNKYPASITGRLNDKDWNNRASKDIHLEMEYSDALTLFVDNAQWNIIQEIEVLKETEDADGNLIMQNVIEEEIYDNSDYSIAGDITDHRDGTVSIKMGKLTAEELLAMFEEVL